MALSFNDSSRKWSFQCVNDNFITEQKWPHRIASNPLQMILDVHCDRVALKRTPRQLQLQLLIFELRGMTSASFTTVGFMTEHAPTPDLMQRLCRDSCKTELRRPVTKKEQTWHGDCKKWRVTKCRCFLYALHSFSMLFHHVGRLKLVNFWIPMELEWMKHRFVAHSTVLQSLDRSACNDSDSCLKRETCPTVAVRIIFLRPKQVHKRSQRIPGLSGVVRLGTLPKTQVLQNDRSLLHVRKSLAESWTHHPDWKRKTWKTNLLPSLNQLNLWHAWWQGLLCLIEASVTRLTRHAFGETWWYQIQDDTKWCEVVCGLLQVVKENSFATHSLRYSMVPSHAVSVSSTCLSLIISFKAWMVFSAWNPGRQAHMTKS